MKFDELVFHPRLERLVEILSQKTQNRDKMFFRIVANYFMCKIASMQQAFVVSEAIGKIPINFYGINLAPSGSGKGKSVGIVEDQVISAFRKTFLTVTWPQIVAESLSKEAIRRANRTGKAPNECLEALEKEFKDLGPLVFSFDSATTAAIKQMRTMLLMGGGGSMNIEIDEIGSNLLGNAEVMSPFLELFDGGKIKQKLTKHTKDNQRVEDRQGVTPTNMLLFGTPTKLLNGGKTEDEFYELLETGYSRRCFYGYSQDRTGEADITPEEFYNVLTDQSSNQFLEDLATDLAFLADKVMFKTEIEMPKDVTIELLRYRQYCDVRANELSEYDGIKKAEIKHRYFKVFKLAGAYAFLDKTTHVSEEQLSWAISLAERSGQAFEKILARDRPYVKLAAYLMNIGRQVTAADLLELPFFKGSELQRKDMLKLAQAHAYKDGGYIKSEEIDEITFWSGKSLQRTDLEHLLVSWSKHPAQNYKPLRCPWKKMAQLCTRTGIQWCNHEFMSHSNYPNEAGYRDEQHVKRGFNLVVLDVDGGARIDSTRELLEEYTYLIYTTKRHTEENHRFRLIFPLEFFVELEAHDYKDFMENICNWLPVEVDRAANQRSRKWQSHNGQYWYNDGELLNPLNFIPKTRRCDQEKASFAKLGSLTNIERWFVRKSGAGNRNNMLTRYAFVLLDQGLPVDVIQNSILQLNQKLTDPLEETEILGSIMKTVHARYHKKKSN